ncbi:MAG: hypothetical protein JWQ07_5906 [Ramlibacter sp.]|nr:hypothetical protein [Ramlibacter sp.]
MGLMLRLMSMRIPLVVAVALLTGSCGGTTVAANGPSASSASCSPVHPVPTGPVAAGGMRPAFDISLDGGSYHRIPTSVSEPARVSVTISEAKHVRLDEVYAVIVREGIDITNGPFARRITLLRGAPATGQRLDVTLPATDETGTPLPPGQYMWGVQADFREVFTDTCGTQPASSPTAQGLGKEMPYLVVPA